MKPMTFKNKLNNEKVVCENVRDVEVIDGEEYLRVHAPNNARTFLMRRAVLERVPEQ